MFFCKSCRIMIPQKIKIVPCTVNTGFPFSRFSGIQSKRIFQNLWFEFLKKLVECRVWLSFKEVLRVFENFSRNKNEIKNPKN